MRVCACIIKLDGTLYGHHVKVCNMSSVNICVVTIYPNIMQRAMMKPVIMSTTIMSAVIDNSNNVTLNTINSSYINNSCITSNSININIFPVILHTQL